MTTTQRGSRTDPNATTPNTAQPSAPPSRSPYQADDQPSGWTGWVVFAGVMMLLIGAIHAVQGFVALLRDTYYLVGEQGLVVQVDYTAWGWVHLGLGILVVLAGIALLAGQMWARVIAVILASASVIVNIAFIGAYPLWSMVIIAIDVLVIWAVTVHGREMKPVSA